MAELVRFETEDELELQGLLTESDVDSSKAILHIHGWIGNFFENAFIDSFFHLAPLKGFSFFAFNNRGSGIITEYKKGEERQPIGGSLEKFEDCLYDIGAALDVLEEKGYHDIILQGHSLGCQKAVFYQDRTNDKRVKGIVLLAPVDDVSFVSRLIDDDEACKQALKIAQSMKDEGQGNSSVPEPMQFYPGLSADMYLQVSDPESESGRIFYSSGEFKELRDLSVPALAIFGSRDEYESHPSDNLERLKKMAGMETCLFQDVDHWLSGKDQELVSKVLDWSEKTIS